MASVHVSSSLSLGHSRMVVSPSHTHNARGIPVLTPGFHLCPGACSFQASQDNDHPQGLKLCEAPQETFTHCAHGPTVPRIRSHPGCSQPRPRAAKQLKSNTAQFCVVGGASGATLCSTSLARARARPRPTVNPEGVPGCAGALIPSALVSLVTAWRPLQAQKAPPA